MILVFGGTTEGRSAVAVLDEGGKAYYYSTKTGEQDVTLRHGQRIDGAMDGAAMRAFCQANGIRLVVDAAHPFASQLHRTIAEVSAALAIPVVRYERIFPERDAGLTWVDDYAQIPRDVHTLLATTGVQSIGKLKPIEARGVRVVYRILPRASSVALAKQQGAADDQLCFYEDGSTIDVDADAILLKESGLSGGFAEKVEAAKAKGMRIIVLKRPAMPAGFHTVDGPHGLRRAVERLLPGFYDLRSGLTTGTCATAAARAQTVRLLRGETPAEVPVVLPNGETISVGVTYGEGYASVQKEAGDDPDVTDGLEIRAAVELVQRAEVPCGEEDEPAVVEIRGGEGVGTFTLPGFDFPPGEAAINKGPRAMIRQNVQAVTGQPLRVTISVPRGREIAARTFNPRLGIEGGISIIGVSGIVKPFSEEAFIESIHKCMEVAVAQGTDRVVINSGAKSERFLRARYPHLPQQAFVEYGNYIGETLRMADELGIGNVTLGIMLGKAVKLAAGHLDTHSRRATMDKDFLSQLLGEAGCNADISAITLARELWTLVPADRLQAFAQTVIGHCYEHCRKLLPKGSLTILLLDDDGRIYQL